MSRCFPFPPPGFEKNERIGDVNLIVKENHESKKHKDKKDKDKKERRERKEKERSEGKHKEDKHKKHRDKKHKSEDKNRSSEEKKIEGLSENPLNFEKESGEIEKNRFLAELGNRIGNGEGATDNHMVRETAPMEQNKTTFLANEKRLKVHARGSGNGNFGNFLEENQKGQIKQREINSDILDLRSEKPPEFPKEIRDGNQGNIRKRKEPEFNGFLHENGVRYKNVSMPASCSSHQISQNGTSGLKKGIVISNHKMNGPDSSSQFAVKNVAKMERGQIANNLRDDHGKPVISNEVRGIMISNHKMNGRDTSPRPAIENVAKMKRANSLRADHGRPVINNEVKGIVISNHKMNGRDQIASNLRADHGRPVINKQVKGVVISNHRMNGTNSSSQSAIKNVAKTDQIGSNSRADHKRPVIINEVKGVVISNHKMNGTDSSSQPTVKNVAKTERGQIANSLKADHRRPVIINDQVITNGSLSVGIGRITKPNENKSDVNGQSNDGEIPFLPPFIKNGSKTIRLTKKPDVPDSSPKTGIKESKTNGILDHKPNALSSSFKGKEKVEANTKPPHPDSKYLCEILTVPKLIVLPPEDDQEWIFGSNGSRAKKTKLPSSEVESTQAVWDKAIRLESEDITILPYVIPY